MNQMLILTINNVLLFSGLSLSKKILPGQVVSVKVEPPLNIHHDQKNPAARLVQLVSAANSVASDGRQVSAPNILKRAKPGATTITLAPKRQMVSTTTYVTTIPSPPSSTTSSINRYNNQLFLKGFFPEDNTVLFMTYCRAFHISKLMHKITSLKIFLKL